VSTTDGYLVLDSLTKQFQSGRSESVRAVDSLSVSVRQGQLMTLLGPSGCGKTTTLRLIAGFEQSTTGHIVLDGATIDDVPAHRREMAMVFQSYAIFPHLDVYENVAYGLRVQRRRDDEVKSRVGQALDLVELGGYERRQPAQLSGGQQQRVALARALIMQPRVLLFDEPLSNLDARLRLQMRDEIRTIQQNLGITAVYVTHDQSEAMALSDVIVVMNHGRAEQIGSPEDLYQRPASRFVADFIGRSNLVEGQVIGHEGDYAIVSTLGRTVRAWDHKRRFSEHQQATLAIRPEAIELKPGRDGASATIRRATYLGSTVEYELEVASTILNVLVHDPRCGPPLPAGATTGFSILDDSVSLIPDDVTTGP
jgi:iron(III) transport system ATP-binding protein